MHAESETHGVLSDRKILLVEDDADGGLMLKLALEREGADVTLVESARDADRSLRERLYDGIVCDIGLPDEDGLSFMRRMRPALLTPAVALTGYTSADDVRRALDSGFDAHVAKPVDPLELARTLARVLAGSSALH